MVLAGMVQHFQGSFYLKYAAGLWEGAAGMYVVEQLLWITSEPAQRPEEAVAPPWSWASVSTPVEDIVMLPPPQEFGINEVHRCLWLVMHV
jgi:hypothetical protein